MSEVAFPEDTRALDAWCAQNVEGFAGPSRAKKFNTGQSPNRFFGSDTIAVPYAAAFSSNSSIVHS